MATTDKKTIKDSDVFMVRSLVEGELVALDPHGDVIIWSEYGDEQELSLKELKHIKRKSKKFFDKCWLRVPEECEKPLRIQGYLDSEIDLDRIDNFFNMDVEKFQKLFSQASDGIRRIVVDKAVGKIRDGKLDSRRIINVIQHETKLDLLFLCEELRLKEEKEKAEANK